MTYVVHRREAGRDLPGRQRAGDPGLFTLKGVRCMQEADAVVYDRLAPGALLGYASLTPRRSTSARSLAIPMSQEEINDLLVEKGRAGMTVVRLKGGDPYIFGRGGEEALALKEAELPFEVVPGVTSGVAAPAYAGIPVTHRNVSTSVAFVTGHEDPTKGSSDVDWERLATAPIRSFCTWAWAGWRRSRKAHRGWEEPGYAGRLRHVGHRTGTTDRHRNPRRHR